MDIFNILILLLLGCFLASSDQNINSSSTIYTFNYHSTVDNRTNQRANDDFKSKILNLNFGNLSTRSADQLINNDYKETNFQPVYIPILNLTNSPSIKQMVRKSFRPDFIGELTNDRKRDSATSESATILINSMNNSRMLNSQKINQFIDNQKNNKNNQINGQNNHIDGQTRTQEVKNLIKSQKANKTNDGDVMKFEDELDIQPHSFNTASRLDVNLTKLISNLETTTTTKPEQEESIGKKLKKKHLQMLQLKKKLKNNPDKFKSIKIRAPRLHISNSTSKLFGDKQARRNKIGYASFVRARNVNLTDYHSDDGVHIKRKRVLQPIQNRELDSSGSENRQIRLIMIHSYKKPAVERFAKRIMINKGGNSQDNIGHQLIGVAGQTHPIFVKLHSNRRLVNAGEEGSSIRGLAQLNNGQSNNNAQTKTIGGDQQSSIQNMFSATYQSGSNRLIPKLLLPRFTRPKMYSLNGFIPKPNSQKFTTTTSSSLNVNHAFNDFKQFQRNKSGRNKADYKQFDKLSNDESGKRRKFGSKSSTNTLDDDDLSTSGSARKRQILFMKRKGFGYEEDELNSIKPKSNLPENKKNRKQLKAIDFQFPKANYPKELLESLNIRPEPPKFEYQTYKKDNLSNKDKNFKSYPVYSEIPKTSFQCPGKVSGVFSDIETRCQVWHMCSGDNQGTKHSFLCANGTVFNERVGVCDHWYNVDCSINNVNAAKLTKLY